LGLAVALAMDAFAVAIVTALSLQPVTARQRFRLGFHFGLFQGLMLLLGWLFGSAAYAFLMFSNHWFAFGLLAFVGSKMIWGATCGQPQGMLPDRTRGWDLVLLSVATSMDALAVGLSLAMIHVRIAEPALVVGIMAAALTIVGMGIGHRVGGLWGKRVELVGGCVLIVIGIRIVWGRPWA